MNLLNMKMTKKEAMAYIAANRELNQYIDREQELKIKRKAKEDAKFMEFIQVQGLRADINNTNYAFMIDLLDILKKI